MRNRNGQEISAVVDARIGMTELSVSDIMQLDSGSIIEFKESAGDPVKGHREQHVESGRQRNTSLDPRVDVRRRIRHFIPEKPADGYQMQ